MSPFKDLTDSTPNELLFKLEPLGMDAESIGRDFQHYYAHTLGRDRDCRSAYYPYKALAITLRDRLMERWKRTRHAHDQANCKRTYYLSLEFLMGRSLSNALLNLGIADEARQALYEMGLMYEEIESAEMDAGLGNGGLGRLAACFLDSCATLQLPVK
ncbi:MAG: glycogen/starch/alpha-glucan phosphorylase, partial [Halochromatium sp.]